MSLIGHFTRMHAGWQVAKRAGECLESGDIPWHKYKKRFTDVVTIKFKILNVNVEDWEQMMQHRSIIYNRFKALEPRRIEQSNLKWALRRHDLITTEETVLISVRSAVEFDC